MVIKGSKSNYAALDVEYTIAINVLLHTVTG